MRSLARLGTTSVVLTYLHLVFGGVVRITGSGMGCGDHWPKCNGSWIPPFDNMLVMVEWTHRLLALLVILSIAWLTLAAWRQPNDAATERGRGVLRPAVLALILVIAVALLGMVTVKLGNTTLATVAHWTLAMALLAVLIAATVRAGGLGGASALAQGGSARAVRSIAAGAALAFVVVVIGGLVAKYPGANVACPSFPHCGNTPSNVSPGASHIQLAHRLLAYLLFFHALAIALAVGRRANESLTVKRTLRLGGALLVAQLVIGATMVLTQLQGHLRVTHQAVGVAVWLVLFLAAYLARTAHGSARHAALDP